MENVALFLFAHQDDEFGIFQQILNEKKQGRRIICCYLTDGSFGGASPARRNIESTAILTKLGVQRKDIYFAGDTLSIHDADLPEHLATASEWIKSTIIRFSPINSIYIPAWEGGHHDHDSLNAISTVIAKEMGLLNRVRQFPLYNGINCKGPFFRVFFPLEKNGKIEKRTIPWKNRFQFLYYCLSYPSQAKTWIGLFPFVLLNYLLVGKQILQPVSMGRIDERPHDGHLYYEKRGFFTWEKMVKALTEWRNQ